MGELVFIFGLIAGLICPFLLLEKRGRILWLITMSIIGAVVGGAELVSKATTGITISRHFWNFSLEHESTAWLVIFLLACGWGVLLVHLAWKMLDRRFHKPKQL